jgi:hypothetical protein
MAKRLLLTLLALFGLATQLAPAQARVCAGAASAVGVVVAARHERAGAVCSAPAARPAALLRPAFRTDPPAPAFAAPPVSAVRTGIDRARE